MRIVKTTICALLLFCTLIFTVGCNSSDSSYPITIGNTTFNSKPEKVAVLSPNVADIVCQLGMEKDITLIAGPNNAGKTSIVEFLKFLFGDTKDKIESLPLCMLK